MTPGEIEVKVRLVQREADYWKDLLAKKSCKDCEHFPEGLCKLAGGIRPPEDVVAVGCDSWKWDGIPF